LELGANKIEVFLEIFTINRILSLGNRKYRTFNQFRRNNSLEKQNKTHSKCENSEEIEVSSHKCTQ